MEDRPILILRPIDVGEPIPDGDTAVADCGHTCWISPVSIAALAEQPMPTACLYCAPSGLQEVRLFPGAREDMVRRFGAEQADAALEEFKAFARRLQAHWQN